MPLRGIFESLGASVAYDQGTINATSGTKTVQVKIGSNQAIVNTHAQYLDASPFIIGATTMVPLRFVSATLGASVDYDSATGTISIATAKEALPAGAALTAALNGDLNSGSAKVGQAVSMTVQPPYPTGGEPLAGAIIYGRVIAAQAAGQGRNAKLELDVDSIKLAGSDKKYPMVAKISKIEVRQGSNVAKEAGGALGGMLIGNWIGKTLGTNAGGAIGAIGSYMLTSNSKTNFDVPVGSKVTMELTEALIIK